MSGDQQTQSPVSADAKAERQTGFWAWLWRNPLLLVILADCVFSIGIWNARYNGYSEDTDFVKMAIASIQTGQLSTNLYANAFTMLLTGIAPDPVTAAVWMRFLTSLSTPVLLFLVLSCFSDWLGRGAILFASFVWISSSVNAPFVQSTSQGSFAFALMLLGTYCLLRSWSVAGAAGFYFFGLTAASVRPEYIAPVLLVTVFLLGDALLRYSVTLESRLGIPRSKTRLGCLLLVLLAVTAILVRPTQGLAQKMSFFDKYLLFGLGQCYAEFYHTEHPAKVFSPMTEYEELLEKTFKKPKTFVGALKHNPREAARYFALNAIHNLKQIPQKLFITRDQGPSSNNALLYHAVLAVLICGAVPGIARLRRSYIKSQSGDRAKGHVGRLGAFWRTHQLLFRKVLILLLLSSASSVSILLLVGLPRYSLSMVPLLYLGLAYSLDSILKQFRLVGFEPLIVAASLVSFCSPNFIIPRPDFEVQALRHIAPLLRSRPVIGAWWPASYAVFAFRGDAKDVGIMEGIKAQDIAAGDFDVLMIDSVFRSTATWAKQRDFFEDLTHDPWKYGFKKLTEVPTGRTDIYYRPRVPAP